MKRTKIISFLMALVLIFSASLIGVYAANTYEDLELRQNVANEISMGKDDVLIAKGFKANGKLTIVTTGYAKPTIKITHKQIITEKVVEDYSLTPSADGNIFEIVDLSALTEYDITITKANALVSKFDLYIFKANARYSGFTAYPATASNGSAPKTFYEDIDFTTSSGSLISASVNFKTEPDFTGARYEFKDDNNACIFALENNDVKQILTAPTFASSVITYQSKLSSILSGSTNSTVTFKAQANPIKSVRVSAMPDPAPSYHFGKDGIIKGKLGNYYFRPDIKFDGYKFEITFKDYVTAADPGINREYSVQKDGKGYYIDLGAYGKQYITYTAEVTQNKTQAYQTTVYVGSGHFGMDVQIEKAGFFEFIGIWFGLLFGKYK